MATMQYIGARYVPLPVGEWQQGTEYEALTIVTYNNNSYTSKKPVPANIGSPNLNPEYWVQTGSYNAQVTELTNKVDELSRSNLEVFSMDAFGADPSGVNESSTALDAAYAAIIAGGRGGQIYFPPGHYKLDRIFIIRHSNVYIVADPAAYISGNFHDDYGGLVSIMGPYKEFPESGDNWNGIENVGVIGGHWAAYDPQMTNIMNVISVGSGVRFARIENVYVDHADRKGISFQWGVTDSIISGCFVSNTTNWGIAVENRCYRNIVANCVVKNCSSVGFHLVNNEGYNSIENCISYKNTDGYLMTYCTDYNRFSGCVAVECQRGIVLSHSGGDVLNSYVEDCETASVLVYGRNSNATPVKIEGCTIKSDVNGIHCINAGTAEEPPHTIINGNSINSSGNPVVYSGIQALGDSNVVLSNNQITAPNTATHAINIVNTLNAVISGNVIVTDKVGIIDSVSLQPHVVVGNRITAPTGMTTNAAQSGGNIAIGNVLNCTTAFSGTQPVTEGNVTI